MKRNALNLVIAAAAATLAGTPALATDLPKPRVVTKAPVQAPEPNWTGFYVGGNAGIGVTQMRATTTPFVGSVNRIDPGFAGGGQIGLNWQATPNWVIGIEGDIGSLRTERSLRDWANAVEFGVRSDWYGTVRGRLGYTNGPSLFFATGGIAYVKVTNNYDELAASVFAERTETARGWTAGGGIESMLGGNWSVRAEYLYIDAGGQDISNTQIFDLGSVAHFENRFHVFRYALNYRFGGQPAAILPANNWSGFYGGANGGISLSQVHAINTSGIEGEIEIARTAFTGGIQGGYNWQAGNFVAGIEGDFGYLGVDHTLNGWNQVNAFGVKADWYGTVRGRAGLSTGPALIYATAGAAFVKVQNAYDFDATDTTVPVSQTKVATGWTAGAGLEASLGGNWSFKTEYLFVDVGNQSTSGPADGTHVFDNRFHVFRFGLNRKFGS